MVLVVKSWSMLFVFAPKKPLLLVQSYAVHVKCCFFITTLCNSHRLIKHGNFFLDVINNGMQYKIFIQNNIFLYIITQHPFIHNELIKVYQTRRKNLLVYKKRHELLPFARLNIQ